MRCCAPPTFVAPAAFVSSALNLAAGVACSFRLLQCRIMLDLASRMTKTITGCMMGCMHNDVDTP
ncbi:hypothetical protein HR12_08090 [Microbacterium sp. SUBG005]|nr:hypothetical protein HR12_08090 [Microbacterium sp. SUBG005]